MAKAKEASARVTLKGAKTYNFQGRRFIQDVPQIVHGDLVEECQMNGHFHVSVLKAAEKKAAAKNEDHEDEAEDQQDEQEEEESEDESTVHKLGRKASKAIKNKLHKRGA